MPTVHLLVTGKVQGVFYRQTAKDMAERKGITGWVRNTDKGHVEITATGSDEALQSFIEWCHVGPSRAVVHEVQVTPLPDQRFERFEVRRG